MTGLLGKSFVVGDALLLNIYTCYLISLLDIYILVVVTPEEIVRGGGG